MPGKQSAMPLLCLFWACSSSLQQVSIEQPSLNEYIEYRSLDVLGRLGGLEKGGTANGADDVASSLVLYTVARLANTL